MGLAVGSSTYFIFVAAIFFVYWAAPQTRLLRLGVVLLANYYFCALRAVLPRADPRLRDHGLPGGSRADALSPRRSAPVACGRQCRRQPGVAGGLAPHGRGDWPHGVGLGLPPRPFLLYLPGPHLHARSLSPRCRRHHQLAGPPVRRLVLSHLAGRPHHACLRVDPAICGAPAAGSHGRRTLAVVTLGALLAVIRPPNTAQLRGLLEFTPELTPLS